MNQFSEKRDSADAGFCPLSDQTPTAVYSSVLNNRAGWNKRAGGKISPILGNFKSLNTCRMDLSYFQ